MKLLSGNPDGFAFDFETSEFDREGQQINYLLSTAWPDFVSSPLLFTKHQIAVCGSSDRVDDMEKLEIFFDYI